jgi:prepilin peptidase CpaA
LDDELLFSTSGAIQGKEMAMHWIAWWPTVAVLAVATFTDLRSRRIPNWLVVPFMVAGLLISGIRGGWHGLAHSFGGLCLGLAVYGVLAVMGGMGMGDVKLCAAIGAWIWSQQLFIALVLTGIAGGVMALVWAAFGGFLGELFSGTGRLIFSVGKRGLKPDPKLNLNNPFTRKMPYAPAIAIGTLISFFSH